MADLKRTLFGYSSSSVRSTLTERDASLDRATENANAAEQRAERLSSELSETQGRLAELEEQLDTAQKLSLTLNADLERAVAERESMEAEIPPLRTELEEVHTELRNAQEAILGQEEQLRAAQAGSASLEERLREQAERLEQAEVAESEGSLQQALEESARYKATVSAQQERLTELEVLVEGYRELVETQGAAAVLSAEPGDAQEPPAGPSTASELAAVIEVAEQAVASIMDSTRVRADEELRAVDGERERIRRDVETMTAWRDRAEPMIVSLQAAMREIQSQGEEIGLRVNEVLRPVSTAVTALGAQLASLDDLDRAPLEVSTEAAAPSEPDHVTQLPEEHPASRDSSDW
jgi:chromosome segregation ATPase